jgi:hypothetical protein
MMSSETKTNGVIAEGVQPTAEVVNSILKWSEEDRRDLALLLADSIRQGFTSLEEAEERDRNLIHDRLEQLKSGTVELHEPEQMFAEIDRRLAEVRK